MRTFVEHSDGSSRCSHYVLWY